MALRSCRVDRSLAKAWLRQPLAPRPSQFPNTCLSFFSTSVAAPSPPPPPPASFPSPTRLSLAKRHNRQTRHYADTRPPQRDESARLATTAAAAHQVQDETRARVPTVTGTTALQPRAADFEVYEDDEDDAGDAHRTNVGKFANFLRGKKEGRATSYFVYTACDKILQNVSAMADYTITREDRKEGRVTITDDGIELGTSNGLWHVYLGLQPSFSVWCQVTMLHLYLVVARMRALDRPQQRVFQRQLLDNFFLDAEARIKNSHGITKTLTLQKHLKDLFTQWRGLLLAYDEGLVRGDAVLAAAVWRNLFAGRPDVDARKLAAVVCWMRECLHQLERLPDNAVLGRAGTVLTTVPVTAELARLGGVDAELAAQIAEAKKNRRPKALMGWEDAAEAGENQEYLLPGEVQAGSVPKESPVPAEPAPAQRKPTGRFVR